MQVSRLGILGGTFDPIHNGHICIAKAAQEYLQLDRVLLIPNGNPYMKTMTQSEGNPNPHTVGFNTVYQVTAAAIRLHLTELAVVNEPLLSVSAIEVNRPGSSYTYETLREIGVLFPKAKLFFILGSDAFCSIETWKNAELIFRNAVLGVFARGDEEEGSLDQHIISMKKKYHADIRMIPMEKIDISSRGIRQMLKEGMEVAKLKTQLPEAVIDYIVDNGLYRGGE
ncbi:MAG: nicotinate-nucleotide adenylyltransferase [Lachnospiraceae bacterium]|jgi:nicotinate-nucleotide adenylyltransferase|nr:nicotinate-nucleotide adenylyltransferase [Lachnospiraceae bacterium]